MRRSLSPKKGTRKSAKSTTATGKTFKGFTDEERVALKERVQELKAAPCIIKASAPRLSPRLRYGMPAYATGRQGRLLLPKRAEVQLPPERAVHILRQVCSSLQDAHGNGLVHRDIKPANVVVSRAGTTFDFAKVLDFGLVKLDSARKAEDDVKLSTEGSTSGTPAFMAPEVGLL